MNMWFKLFEFLLFPTVFLLLSRLLTKNEYRQAGKRLLLLPMSKDRKFVVIVFSVVLYLSGFYIMTKTGVDDGDYWYSPIGAGICGGALSLWLQIQYPTELREYGVMSSGHLIEWSCIQSHEWQDIEHLTLRIKSKFWKWKYHRKWKVRVAPLASARVEKILQKKLFNNKNYATS